MKTLTIRRVPEDVHEALRVKAAKAGQSMEALLRRYLKDMVMKAQKKPDFTALRELQERVAASLPKDAPSAAEMVRQMRDEDNAAVDAKWARIDADLKRIEAKTAAKAKGRAD